jgi:hypothetical protein
MEQHVSEWFVFLNSLFSAAFHFLSAFLPERFWQLREALRDMSQTSFYPCRSKTGHPILYSLEALTATTQQMQAALADADIQTKREILRGFIDHVEVMSAGNHLQGTIYFYYPPPLPKTPGPDGVPISRILSGLPLFGLNRLIK